MNIYIPSKEYIQLRTIWFNADTKFSFIEWLNSFNGRLYLRSIHIDASFDHIKFNNKEDYYLILLKSL